MTPRIRLILVHERVLFRTSLARLLSAEPDFEFVAECASVAEAEDALNRSEADLILFDFEIWRNFVSAAREAGYHGRFLAIAEQGDAAQYAKALSCGISGVVPSSESLARLIQAIHVVASGGAWLDPSMIQLLADGYPHREELRLDNLTTREQSVLRGILDGLSNRKIANRIGVSEGSVKAILHQMFDKTGVRTRSQLVRIMLADGAPLATPHSHG